MIASEVIKELQEAINKYGDLPCTAWQHEEEYERSKEISCIWPHKENFGRNKNDKVISFHIS